MQTMPAKTRKAMTVGAIVLGLAIVGGVALYANRGKAPTTQSSERPATQQVAGKQTQQPATGNPLNPALSALEQGDKPGTASATAAAGATGTAGMTGTTGTAGTTDSHTDDSATVPAGTATGEKDASAMAAADVPETYMVNPGDSLREIAMKFYRDPIHSADIEELNELPDPDHITAGQILKMPRPEDLKH